MHDRMRKLVNRAFTPRRIAEWEPVAAKVIHGLLDELDGSAGFDAVVDFAGPFPVEVICSIVGVPEGDRQQIRHWTDAMLELEVGNPFPTAAGIDASIALNRYMEQLVADRRLHPTDDMIGHLIEAEVEREDGEVEHLDDGEISRFITLLAAAGRRDGDEAGRQRRRRRSRSTPTSAAASRPTRRWPASAVEEILRWKAPSQYQGRYCLEDRTLNNVTIPAGSPTLVITGAANRDERAYEDPDRFDITRTGPLGISFGHGIHYCIGAHLARLEGRIAFTELYRRWPDLQVDLDTIRYVHMSNVAGPSSVPVAAC